MSGLDLACELARSFEGLCLYPYLCPAGVPTIGYGTTRYPGGTVVSLNDSPITRADAEKLLRYEMQAGLDRAFALSPSLASESEGKQAAIADFIYNLGSGRYAASTLRKRIESGDFDDVPDQLRRWTKAGGRQLRGLVLRREAEISLWLK